MVKKFLALVCAVASTSMVANAASSKADLNTRLSDATTVLNEVMATPDKSVPLQIMAKATCVGIVPSMKKGAFLFGGQYGQGAVTCRTGHGWSGPVFIRLAGGSFGLQIGGQSTDLILVAVNDRGMQSLLKSKFKIGGDVAASAGPVGRNSQASTDILLHSELLTYSRSKGLFGGIDLDGTSISQNTEDTDVYYGSPHPFEDILSGKVGAPEASKPFVRTVAKYFVKSQLAK